VNDSHGILAGMLYRIRHPQLAFIASAFSTPAAKPA